MKVLVLGGGGFCGSMLARELIEQGHDVNVLDMFIFEPAPFVFRNLNLTGERGRLNIYQGDVRMGELRRNALKDVDVVFHLAAIANDPNYDLDPALSESMDFDAFEPLLEECGEAGVNRFIYASSSSVYGTKPPWFAVTEKARLEPITGYAKMKVRCEEILFGQPWDFTVTAVRPATIFGWSWRLRLDTIVNLMISRAIEGHPLVVHGGEQMRAHIDVRDVTNLYIRLMEARASTIDGKVFNAVQTNMSVLDLAEKVRDFYQKDTGIDVEPVEDVRSYTLAGDRAASKLGFTPQFSITDGLKAICGMVLNEKENSLPLTQSRYHNIQRFKEMVQG